MGPFHRATNYNYTSLPSWRGRRSDWSPRPNYRREEVDLTLPPLPPATAVPLVCAPVCIALRMPIAIHFETKDKRSPNGDRHLPPATCPSTYAVTSASVSTGIRPKYCANARIRGRGRPRWLSPCMADCEAKSTSIPIVRLTNPSHSHVLPQICVPCLLPFPSLYAVLVFVSYVVVCSIASFPLQHKL